MVHALSNKSDTIHRILNKVPFLFKTLKNNQQKLVPSGMSHKITFVILIKNNREAGMGVDGGEIPTNSSYLGTEILTAGC